ncbi:MAG: hypothetical protein M1162_03325 [Candidatus Thermoplasmatota archaeon]|nr:hypothetical protein [Candidatus Thermoplasmatota archaeon]
MYRCNWGWSSDVFLGISYSILEEGHDTQSFTNPDCAGTPGPAQYSRFLGANGDWSLHTVV